ncbi:MAG: hypothetical protein WBP81_05390 [Solirubrobacteraceae bacterium]
MPEAEEIMARSHLGARRVAVVALLLLMPARVAVGRAVGFASDV